MIMEQKSMTVKINGKGFKKFNKNLRETTQNVKELNKELQRTLELIKLIHIHKEDD